MSKPAPRILYLTSSWPRGKAFGGQLRALHIGRALQKIGDLTMVVVSSGLDEGDSRQKSAEEFVLEPPVVTQPAPNVGILQKLRWAFDTTYLNVHGCRVSPSDTARISEIVRQYDLVWVLNSRTPNILDIWKWPGTHLDIDDIPSTYHRAVEKSETNLKARLRARLEHRLFRRRESRLLERFTTLSVCSDEDRRYLGGSEAIHVIPNGFERPSAVPSPNPSRHPPRIGFIGLYSYLPNRDGVEWFLKHVWPLIRAAIPGIRFRLAGKGTDGELKPAYPDVDALGWLDDSTSEIATWSAMVIPIRFGGGTRIKIADAFSRKCPVVSTSLGAFGYAVEDGNQLRLADTPESFAAACVEMVKAPEKAAAMAERAWTEFLEKWTWDAIAPRVWNAAEDCLRRSGKRIPAA